MIKLIQNRKFTGIITFLLAIEIFLFSTIKTTEGISTGINLALFYHFGIFFLFAFFLFLTIKGKNKTTTKQIILTLIISIIYAISDEFHQFFVPGRTASLFDILIDTAGITLAILSHLFIKIKNQ